MLCTVSPTSLANVKGVACETTHPHNKIYLYCLDEGHTRTSSTVNSAEENLLQQTGGRVQFNTVVKSTLATPSPSLASKEDSAHLN